MSGVDEPFDAAEELANGLTHGFGLLLGIAGLVLVVVFAALRGTVWHVVGGSIFGATLVLLYASSTLYHSLRPGRAKRLFGIFDHAAIFLLIAGTYTPFMLGPLRGPWGWTLFGMIWALAICGVLLEAITKGRARRLQLALYLGMGWLIVVALKPLVDNVSPGGLALLGAGGAAYTLGVIFYVWKRLRYHHAIWHLFVIAGSVCHVLAILFYVVQGD